MAIGEITFIGARSQFDVLDRVEVGSHTLISPVCFITDHNHGIELGRLRIDQQPCVPHSVIIGSDVWLGAGVVVLPGVSIGEGAVVGTGAVVVESLPDFAVAVGIPARVIRQR